jgi:hypothetical protein
LMNGIVQIVVSMFKQGTNVFIVVLKSN